MSGSIYFVTAEGSNRVKIGYTSGDPHARLKALQTGCPQELVIIGVERGSQRRERDLHDRFAKQRVIGEWFEIDSDLREYIIAINCRAYEEDTNEGVRPPKWARVFYALTQGATLEEADAA